MIILLIGHSSHRRAGAVSARRAATPR
jgi:hypothetical protein